MPRPYTLRIPVEEDYLEAAGEAFYNFAYAEGVIAYLVNSLIPGYITLTRGRTADEIARDLKLASSVKPNADIDSVAEAFSSLVAKRDSLLLARPITSKDDGQILSSLGDSVAHSWVIDDLWKFAEEAQDVALDAQKLIVPAKS
ncbi:hypothetical protein HDF16_005413 [Granulicella aggregans]|uniref:Uncharacterized protein n=1 Tax=Granulicella aggregans TaxID=474949 RepID=A0A7W8E6H3_9BACT|nr:hypothetical protein [Granulicella aggregans]MBB5060677.1 hypothetical protein [Granulicella aggregans]